MTHGISYEAAVRQLTAMGVPREMAEREARLQIAEGARLPEQRETAQELPVIWPLTLTIPWSHLVSDNDKAIPQLRGGKPIIAISTRYAQARTKIETIATRATAGGAPSAGVDLELVATVYMPSARRADPTNFCKLIQDALEHIVYQNDSWLGRVVYERLIDVDHPRAEITIKPLVR